MKSGRTGPEHEVLNKRLCIACRFPFMSRTSARALCTVCLSRLRYEQALDLHGIFGTPGHLFPLRSCLNINQYIYRAYIKSTYNIALLESHKLRQAHVLVHVIVVGHDALAINGCLLGRLDVVLSPSKGIYLSRALSDSLSELLDRTCPPWHLSDVLTTRLLKAWLGPPSGRLGASAQE